MTITQFDHYHHGLASVAVRVLAESGSLAENVGWPKVCLAEGGVQLAELCYWQSATGRNSSEKAISRIDRLSSWPKVFC